MHLNMILFQTKHTCTVSCATDFDYDNMDNGGFYCLNWCLLGRQTEKCFYHSVENVEIDCYSYLKVIKSDVPVFPLNQRELIFDLTALIVTLLASQETEFLSAFNIQLQHFLLTICVIQLVSIKSNFSQFVYQREPQNGNINLKMHSAFFSVLVSSRIISRIMICVQVNMRK